MRTATDDHDWLAAVYADESLVTQISGAYQPPCDMTPVRDHIENAITAYRAVGAPQQHEFRFTIRGDRQTISIPGTGLAWDLPALSAYGGPARC